LVRRGVGTALFAVTVFLWPNSAGAQSDLLDQARRLREVAAQKLEADVRDALRQAQALSASDPAQAVALLRQTLNAVEQDSVLSADRRDTLRQTLRSRLRTVEALAARVSGPGGDNTARLIQDANRRAGEQAAAREQEQIERTIGTIRKLRSEGRLEEASRMAVDLARQYPDSAAAQAAARIHSAVDRAVDLRNLRIDRERRTAGTLGEVEASSTPPAGDMDFPADWKDKIERRSRLLVRMSPKEKALVESLNSPISVSFKGSRFEDVINELEKAWGQSILLDQQSLNEAQVTYETTVNVQLNNVTFRTALRKVLADLGLTYVIKDQTIQVMSPGRARELMSVRAYYIGDLLFNAGFPLPPALNQLQAAQMVVQLSELIQQSVDPMSWATNGGWGTIAFDPASMSLVIKQSAEMHLILGGGLGGASR
jgi:hypothetical protein